MIPDTILTGTLVIAGKYSSSPHDVIKTPVRNTGSEKIDCNIAVSVRFELTTTPLTGARSPTELQDMDPTGIHEFLKACRPHLKYVYIRIFVRILGLEPRVLPPQTVRFGHLSYILWSSGFHASAGN